MGNPKNNHTGSVRNVLGKVEDSGSNFDDVMLELAHFMRDVPSVTFLFSLRDGQQYYKPMWRLDDLGNVGRSEEGIPCRRTVPPNTRYTNGSHVRESALLSHPCLLTELQLHRRIRKQINGSHQHYSAFGCGGADHRQSYASPMTLKL